MANLPTSFPNQHVAHPFFDEMQVRAAHSFIKRLARQAAHMDYERALGDIKS